MNFLIANKATPKGKEVKEDSNLEIVRKFLSHEGPKPYKPTEDKN